VIRAATHAARGSRRAGLGVRAIGTAVAMLAMSARGSAQSRPAISYGTVDSMESKALGEWRRYSLYIPPSYDQPSRFPRRYPVLYLLDGETYFASVVSIVQLLATGVNGTWALPEMIVVGVHSTNRRRDFTPTRITRDPYGGPLPPGWDVTGGNPRFHEFLIDELIPRIDSAYRTAGYRAYVGHSLGGLSVLNALYNRPETFNAYVAIDPTLWMDDQLMVREAPSFFTREAPPRRALFIAQGNNITPYDTGTAINHLALLRLNSVIAAENRSGIRYGYRFYEREDHGSIPFIAEYDALRWLFEGYEVHLPRAASFPGYLTEHFEALSEQLGYRAIPPEGAIRFTTMLSAGEPQGLAAPRDVMSRVMGTWVRDSATGPDDAAPPKGETVILTARDAGFHLIERDGGPTGDERVSIDCVRATAAAVALAPGERRRCQLAVSRDSVVYTVYAAREGGVFMQERGVLTTSRDGRTLRDEFTAIGERGTSQRHRHVYARLY